MCVLDDDRVAPGQRVRDAVLATVTQCLRGGEKRSHFPRHVAKTSVSLGARSWNPRPTGQSQQRGRSTLAKKALCG